MNDLSDNVLHRKLLEAAQSHINSGTFAWVIPPLTRPSWKAALSSNNSLRGVYALQGISLLKGALGAELRSRFPGRSWNFYSSIRDAVLSDVVCSAMMINQGATHADAKVGDTSIAEGFATILGVFSEEQGFQNFGRWMKKTYSGLFDTLQTAFDSHSNEIRKAKRDREGHDSEHDANQGSKRLRTEKPAPLTPANLNIPQSTPIRLKMDGEGHNVNTPTTCSVVVCDPRRPPQPLFYEFGASDDPTSMPNSKSDSPTRKSDNATPTTPTISFTLPEQNPLKPMNEQSPSCRQLGPRRESLTGNPTAPRALYNLQHDKGLHARLTPLGLSQRPNS